MTTLPADRVRELRLVHATGTTTKVQPSYNERVVVAEAVADTFMITFASPSKYRLVVLDRADEFTPWRLQSEVVIPIPEAVPAPAPAKGMSPLGIPMFHLVVEPDVEVLPVTRRCALQHLREANRRFVQRVKYLV